MADLEGVPWNLEPLFWRAGFENTMHKCTMTTYTRPALELRILKRRFYSCIAPSAARDDDMLSVWERLLISQCLVWITSCFAPSAARSRVRHTFNSACNFTQRLHKKRSQKVRNPKFSWEGHAPRLSYSRRTCELWLHTGTPLFQNSRSATDIYVVTDELNERDHLSCLVGCIFF